jgi:hypothetical protein
MDDDARLRMREHAPDEEDVWFEPKRYGYGAGLPIRREGWITLGGYVAAMILMAVAIGPLAHANPLFLLCPAIVMAGATLWFVPLCARHTRGGWRWRWGDDA